MKCLNACIKELWHQKLGHFGCSKARRRNHLVRLLSLARHSCSACCMHACFDIACITLSEALHFFVLAYLGLSCDHHLCCTMGQAYIAKQAALFTQLLELLAAVPCLWMYLERGDFHAAATAASVALHAVQVNRARWDSLLQHLGTACEHMCMSAVIYGS